MSSITTDRVLGVSALMAGFILTTFSGASMSQEAVAKSAEETKPLQVGTTAPESTLRGLDGKTIKLRKVLSGEPTVLIFYRGGWCPFCNAHLSELATIERDIRKRGYQIIAISPDLPAELAKMSEKEHLTYKLFSDSNAEAMKKFGVAFRVDDATFTKYRDSFNIDIEKSSGQDHHILPVPSVFVLDRTGKITFAYSNADYKVRLRTADLLKAIELKR